MALRHRVGLIVIDNFDEIERLRELIADGALGATARPDQPVLVRVTPDVRGETHEKISTGQADSKFGFAIDRGRARRSSGLRAVAGLTLLGRARPHRLAAARAGAVSRRAAAALASLGEFPVWDLGGGLGVRYTEDQQPRRRRSRSTSARSSGAARARRGAGDGAC